MFEKAYNKHEEGRNITVWLKSYPIISNPGMITVLLVLHPARIGKQTKQLHGSKYSMKIWYRKKPETEKQRSTHKVIAWISAHRSDRLFAHGARDATWSRSSGGLLRQLLLQLCEHLCSVDVAYRRVCEEMFWTSLQLSMRHFRVLVKQNGLYPGHMQISFWCYSLLPWLCGENHNIRIPVAEISSGQNIIKQGF